MNKIIIEIMQLLMILLTCLDFFLIGMYSSFGNINIGEFYKKIKDDYSK